MTHAGKDYLPTVEKRRLSGAETDEQPWVAGDEARPSRSRRIYGPRSALEDGLFRQLITTPASCSHQHARSIVAALALPHSILASRACS